MSFCFSSLSLRFTTLPSYRGQESPWLAPSLFKFWCLRRGPCTSVGVWNGSGAASCFFVFGPRRPAFHRFSFVKPFSDLSARQALSRHSVRWIIGAASRSPSPSRSLGKRRPFPPRRRRVLPWSCVSGGSTCLLRQPPLPYWCPLQP